MGIDHQPGKLLIVKQMLKVILDCVVFARLCYVINLENLFHLLNRSGTNLKPMATCSFVFSCPALDILIQAFLT